MKRSPAIILLLVAVVCFWLAGSRQRGLVQARRDFHLTQGDPLQNTPPLVAFTTVAMGGFRGVIADLLWLRASQLQQDGKYFELVQLADWITKLEPRMKQVWAFHAWNMAYNVSVLFNNPQDRWRWVRQGIVLLRDEGLRYNPGEANLYHELGWIFEHKMSGDTDQMNVYYKRWWADEMATLFDGPRPDYAAYLADGPAVADRVRRMKEVYKLDPAIMQKVDQLYGPLDWRLPQAHAIYWAYRGKAVARGFDVVQLDRMIFQSMSDAALQGELFTNSKEKIFMPGPNLAVFAKTRKAYEQAIADHPDESTIQGGYRNFLRTALLILYTHNRIAEAQDAFNKLRKRFWSPEYDLGLDHFIFAQMTQFLSEVDKREATDIIIGSLKQSWLWLAVGDESQAEGYQKLARTTYREYENKNNTDELKQRRGLAPFEALNAQAHQEVNDYFQAEAAKKKSQPGSALKSGTLLWAVCVMLPSLNVSIHEKREGRRWA